MPFDPRITGFLAQDVAASRPAAPNEDVTTLSWWFSTDTKVLSYYDWVAAAWVDAVGAFASTTEQLTGTSSTKASTPNSVAALWEQGADVASAGTVSLGEGGYFHITGTTTITDIDFATDKAGRLAWVEFTGILILTHNASTLILPTGANITTAVGDIACFVSEGTDIIRCLAYLRKDGTALAGTAGSVIIKDEGGAVNTATTLNFVGAGVTATDAGGGTATITIPGGGSGMVLVSSFTYSVDVANVAFTGLGGYSELFVLVRDITLSVTGIRTVVFSVDGGATYFTTSGDYRSVSSGGAEASITSIPSHTGNSTGARSGGMHVLASNENGDPKPVISQYGASAMFNIFDGSTSPIDAIRVQGSGGGNITGGSIYVFGRV